jgi:dephospho-CoA kinase
VKTIGLVGGVASGKSLVANMLVELGAGLLDADRAGHDVLAEDRAVHEALRQRWGSTIFTADGRVDRSALAQRVFGAASGAEEERRFLEGLLHPRIRERLEEQQKQLAAEGKRAAVLDAPLLLEAGWDPACDLVLMVDTPRESRLHRALRRGWTEAEFARREAAQWPVDQKSRASDAVIPNGGSVDELRAAVRTFWERYVVA